MSPWAWVVASVGVTVVLALAMPSLPVLLVGQAALFVLMWWYNARRQGRRTR